MATRTGTTFIEGLGNIPFVVYMPEVRRVERIETLKGEITPAEYQPKTYLVDKKGFEAFADMLHISDRRLYFEDIRRHMDTAKLAQEIGCAKNDIKYCWTREEADGIPPHPTARMDAEYARGWARHAPHIDHSRVKGTVIVELKDASIRKLGDRIRLNTLAEITEW